MAATNVRASRSRQPSKTDIRVDILERANKIGITEKEIIDFAKEQNKELFKTQHAKIRSKIDEMVEEGLLEKQIVITQKGRKALQKSSSSKRHVFDDYEGRLELAKLIGLDEVPDLNPNAFDEIKGILANKMHAKRFDPVELVREERSC